MAPTRTVRGAVLAFDAAHNEEHYGNLVGYVRVKEHGPPSTRTISSAAEVAGGAMRQTILVATFLAVTVAANGQPVMIFGGYESDHASFSIPGTEAPHSLFADGLQGWTAGVVAPVQGGVAFVGRVAGMYGQNYETSPVIGDGRLRPHLYTYEGGVRFMHDATRRVTPFVEGVFGMTKGQVGVQGHEGGTAAGAVVFAPVGESHAEGGIGVGFDVHLSRLVGLETAARYAWGAVADDGMNRLQIGVSFVWWPARK